MSGASLTRLCWCGATLSHVYVSARSFRVLRCGACGTFAIDPAPISSDSQSADFYTAYYSLRQTSQQTEGSSAGRVSRFWRVVDQVPGLEQSRQSAVDFGSGEGRLCYELSEAGWSDVAGLDISRARVERARRLYPHLRFFDRPIEESGLAELSSDLCVMDNVIEHLTDPCAQLMALRRYLKPDGRIVVITPNMESGHFRLLGRRWTPELAPHAHVYLFTPRSLGDAVTRSGYEVERSGEFHDDPYPLAKWARRLLGGDVKGAVWRAHQEMGAWYGRFINRGPMQFVVARPLGSATAHSQQAAVRS